MKKKKTIKINKKTLARNLLLALVVIALAIVVPQAVKGAVNKGKTEDDSKTAPTYIDLSQYPSLCEFLREKNIDTEKVISVSVLPKNISSNRAVYGGVLYFKAVVKYAEGETEKEFTSENGISFMDTGGLDSPNAEAVMMSAEGEHSIKLKFFDYETAFNVNISKQVVTNEKERLINKYARVSEDYTAGNITTSYDVNFVYGTDDEVSQMEEEALGALTEMLNAASDAGYTIYALSGYRSYELQTYLYERAGGDAQDTTAPPGGSEHQSGLAMDMTWGDNYYSLSEDQENTSEYDWLTANCANYGFVLRYTKGYEDITGYIYEPWHFRYLGKDMAKEYYNSGAHTLEEFMAEPR